MNCVTFYIRLSQLGIFHIKDLSGRSCLGSIYLCQTPTLKLMYLVNYSSGLTSLKRSQGTPVKAGSKLSVSSPISWSRLKPSSDSAHSRTLSAEVVVMANISKQESEASGGKSEFMMQLIKGIYSCGSVTCTVKYSRMPLMFSHLVKYTGLHEVPVTFLGSVLTHERPTTFRLRKLQYDIRYTINNINIGRNYN